MERSGAVFECVVVDNTCFWKTGRIKIRICKSTSVSEGAEDFSINPQYSRNYNKENFGGNEDENLEGDGVIDHDDYAELSTCMGGAYDAGMFYLPQPNTHGLVTNIYCAGMNKPRYVWIGALMTTNPAYNVVLNPVDEADYISDINMPSDNLDTHNGLNSSQLNLEKPENRNHAIIFKQKETYWSKDDKGMASDRIQNNDDSKESLNWGKVPTLNMAVIDKSRTFITHNMYDKDNNYLGVAKIDIDNENGVSINFNKTQDDEYFEASMEILTNGTAKLTSNYNNKIMNKFEATPEDLTILHKEDDAEGSIVLTKGLNPDDGHILTLSLKNAGDKTETIELKKGMINIISSKDITLNPGPGSGNIIIGGGSGTNYLLAYPSNGIGGSGAISNFEAGSVVACTKIRV